MTELTYQTIGINDITMTSEIKVVLARTNADEHWAIRMAQASLGDDDGWTLDPKIDPARFLKALVGPRHGVPFEHDIWNFYMEVPIFVARQIVKHRHASMNEMSGRYVKMKPKFYTAPEHRNMINHGTKMKPDMQPANETTQRLIRYSDKNVALCAWREYLYRLELGIAEEYARTVLPLHTMTQFYWSVNTRALMGFLERRVDDPDNRVETHPQWETDFAARQVEAYFKEHMPLTHAAFVACGRVMP